jgi:hypothetical protein
LIEVLEEDPTQAPSDVHTAQIIRLSNRRPHLVTVNISDVETTPAWDSITNIQPGVSQTLDIVSGQNFVVADQNITSGFWGAYTGSGNVTFSARDVQTITTTGDSFGQNAANAKVTTQFAIVYSFSIPEPSTTLLGGLAGLLLFRRRR